MDKYARPYEKRRTQIIKSIYQTIPFEKVWEAADVGSGIGFYADIIKPRVANVICLDASPDKVKVCNSKGYKALCHDLNQGLPYEDSKFNFVNVLEVIEHLEDPSYFLRELKRVTKSNGYVLLSTLNRVSPEGWKGKIVEKVKRKQWNGWDNTHKHLFSYSDFINIVNQHFKIFNIIGYYFGIKILNRNFPNGIWQLRSSAKMLRRFGFYIIVLAKNHKQTYY